MQITQHRISSSNFLYVQLKVFRLKMKRPSAAASTARMKRPSAADSTERETSATPTRSAAPPPARSSIGLDVRTSFPGLAPRVLEKEEAAKVFAAAEINVDYLAMTMDARMLSRGAEHEQEGMFFADTMLDLTVDQGSTLKNYTPGGIPDGALVIVMHPVWVYLKVDAGMVDVALGALKKELKARGVTLTTPPVNASRHCWHPVSEVWRSVPAGVLSHGWL